MYELFHRVRMRRVVVGTFATREAAVQVRDRRQSRQQASGLPVTIYQISRVA